ncbi:MAG: hypothetical protein EXX96DRAFT_127675 [Benjaminiella poitrasii]|nr:MAG: hypothetical protein EXX96DRAFT_127675 [Benjaminiella poitrasii]
MNNNSSRPTITSPLATPITTTPSKSRIPSRIIRSNTTVPPITNKDNNINVTKAGSLLPQSITGRRWSSYDTTENKSKATSPQKEAADRKLSRQSVLIADPTQNHRRLNTLMIVNNSRRPLPSQHENATILDHDGKPLEASTFKVIRRKSIHIQKSSDNIHHLSDKKDRQYDSLSSNDNKQSRNNLSSNDKRTSSIHRGNSSEQLNKTPQRYNSSSRRLTTTASPHHDSTHSPPALIVPPTRHSSRVASLSIGNSQRANHDIRKSSLVNTTSSLSKKHPITTNTTSTIHLQHKEPVPVATRYRRSSNQAIASAASKDEAITFDIIPTKEVRFSNPIANSPHLLHEQVIDVVASRSSGGFSNSTTSSSHSGDLYYDPPATAHHHKRDSPILMSSQRRKSTTVLNTTTSEPTHLKKPSEYRYSSYLSHIKNQKEHNHIENAATGSAASRLIALSRKQRTFVEDHNGSINNNSSSEQLPRQRASSLYQSVSASPTRSSSRYNTLHRTRSNQNIIVEQRSLCSKENNNTIESVTASARKVLGLIRQRRSNQSLRTY